MYSYSIFLNKLCKVSYLLINTQVLYSMSSLRFYEKVTDMYSEMLSLYRQVGIQKKLTTEKASSDFPLW